MDLEPTQLDFKEFFAGEMEAAVQNCGGNVKVLHQSYVEIFKQVEFLKESGRIAESEADNSLNFVVLVDSLVSAKPIHLG